MFSVRSAFRSAVTVSHNPFRRAFGTQAEVISGFRKLMRLRKIAFASDEFAINASARELKTQFALNKEETDPSKIAEMIQGISEVEEMLKLNIVQAQRNDSGNYAVNFTEAHKKSMRNEEELKIITEDGIAQEETGCCGGNSACGDDEKTTPQKTQL